MFGSHSMGHTCATYGYIIRERQYFPLLPGEERSPSLIQSAAPSVLALRIKTSIG